MLRRGAQHRQGQGAVCQGAQSPSRGSVICGHGGGPGELRGEQVVGSLQSRQAGAPLLRVWLRAHQAGLGEVWGEGLAGEQSGAAEACWAHNPEVDGSKPSSATAFIAGSCQAFVPLLPFLSQDSYGCGCCAPSALSLSLSTLLLCFLASQHSKRAPQQGRLLWSSRHTSALNSAQDTLAALLAMPTLSRLHTPTYTCTARARAAHVRANGEQHQQQQPGRQQRALRKTEKTEVFLVAVPHPCLRE